MAFDPNKPQANTPVDAVEIRNQLNGLNDKIDAQAATITALQQTVAQLQQQVADNLADTSHNIWGQMPNLDPGWVAQPNYDPADFQWVLSRMIEFNNGLARA